MVFGNGNGNGDGRSLIEQAARSELIAGAARLAILLASGIGFPLAVAAVVFFLDWASAQNKLNEQQTLAIQRLSDATTGQMDLLRYRLAEVEKVNAQQEDHFRYSDRRLVQLERVVPSVQMPSNPGHWPQGFDER